MTYENDLSLTRSSIEMNSEPKIEVTCLGPILEGMGKIHSELEQKDYEMFGEALKQSIAIIEEPGCPACKDGRLCLHHADNTPYTVRARIGGASGAALAMMMLGDRNYLEGLEDTTSSGDDLYKEVNALMTFLKNKPGAHNECGALIGLKDHLSSIANATLTMPNIKVALEIAASIEPVDNMHEVFTRIQRNAAAATSVLEERGWDGAKYTETIRQEYPRGVEELEVDSEHLTGGHKEMAIAIVRSPVDKDMRPIYSISDLKLLELTGEQAFTINQDEITRNAALLSSSRRQKGQLLTASWVHQVAGVAYNLTDGSQPVYIVNIGE